MADRVKYRSTTYLGQRCLVREIREAGTDGVREILHHWLDAAKGQPVEYPAGTTTSRTITGNQRRGTYRELTAEHVVNTTEFYK